MAGPILRFLGGLLVGATIGFFLANFMARPPQTQGPAAAAPAPAPAPAAAPDAAPASAPAATRGDADLTDDELKRAIAAVDAQPDNYEAQFKLGEFLLRIRNQPADAIRFYERASKIKPDDVDALVGVGDSSLATAISTVHDASAYDKKLLDAADAAYTRALKIEPKNAGVRAAVGMIYTLRRPADLVRAIREFDAALQIDATNELALQGLATSYAAKGDVSAAEAALARLEAANPQSPGLARARRVVEDAKKK